MLGGTEIDIAIQLMISEGRKICLRVHETMGMGWTPVLAL